MLRLYIYPLDWSFLHDSVIGHIGVKHNVASFSPMNRGMYKTDNHRINIININEVHTEVYMVYLCGRYNTEKQLVCSKLLILLYLLTDLNSSLKLYVYTLSKSIHYIPYLKNLMGKPSLLTAVEEVHSHTSEDCITAGKRTDQAEDASKNQQHQADR